MGYLRSLFSTSEKNADANFTTLGAFDAQAQGANVSSTILYAIPANYNPGQNLNGSTSGTLFAVSGLATVTTAATTSSTLPSIVIAYTDADTGNSMSLTLTSTSTGNALTTVQASSAAINAKPGTNIYVSTTSYASSGTTSMAYNVHVRVEAM